MQANPQLGNARDLLLKRVEIQHQVRNICMSIHRVMLKNLLLVSNPKSDMNDLKKYYCRKHRVILILMISVKHITKPLEGKRRGVYSLESQAKSYHSPNLHTSSGSDATSPATLLNVKSTLIGDLLLNVPSTPIGNVEELVMQLIPILMDHMLPIFVEGVRRAFSSPPNTHTDQQLWHLLLLLLLTLTRFMHRFLMTMVTLQPRIS